MHADGNANHTADRRARGVTSIPPCSHLAPASNSEADIWELHNSQSSRASVGRKSGAHYAILQGILPCVPDYRRKPVSGGMFFFTVNLLDRRSDLLATQIQALRDGVRQVRLQAPFHIHAWVLLPDHMQCTACGPYRQVMPTSPVAGARSRRHSRKLCPPVSPDHRP